MLTVGKFCLAALLFVHFSLFPRLAVAASLPVGFSIQYVTFYKKFKSTHELARESEKYVHANVNMAGLIDKVRASSDEPLPEVQLRGGKLYFKAEGKTYELIHRGGSQFLWNGKLIDLAKDLSSLTASYRQINNWVVPSANAVAPLVILVVALMFVIAGAAVCTNLGIEKYFNGADLRISWKRPPGKFNFYLKGIQAQLSQVCPGAANASEVAVDYDYERFFSSYCGALTPHYRETRAIMASRKSVEVEVAERFYGPSVNQNNKDVIAAVVSDVDFMKACIEDSRPAVNPHGSADSAVPGEAKK